MRVSVEPLLPTSAKIRLYPSWFERLLGQRPAADIVRFTSGRWRWSNGLCVYGKTLAALDRYTLARSVRARVASLQQGAYP